MHLLKDCGVLGGIVPFESEGVDVAVGGVGYRDHLVQVGWDADELWQVGLIHGTGGFAVMEIGPVGVVVQRSNAGHGGDVAVVSGLPGFFGGVTL